MLCFYKFIYIPILILFESQLCSAFEPAYDYDLYDSVINDSLCEIQLASSPNNNILWNYFDASAKIPSGILSGNLIDFGNFHQCLELYHELDQLIYSGKYCLIYLDISGSNNTFSQLKFSDPTMFDKVSALRTQLKAATGLLVNSRKRGLDNTNLKGETLTLGFCIPRVCQLRKALDSYFNHLMLSNVSYTEGICRLPDDRPLSNADIIMILLSTVLGILIILSTGYDLYYAKREVEIKPKNVLLAFSLYTNTIQLCCVTKKPGSIECLDGIRAISMLWVIMGHTFSNTPNVENVIYAYTVWIRSFWNLWLTAAPIAVDTFFLMSGILLAYCIVPKFTAAKFLKSLHLYVLNRYLRMLPIYATVILLQASLLNHLTDGPERTIVAQFVENCRQNWWLNLLYLQNYIDPSHMCIGHSWYMAVDTHAYLLGAFIIIFLFDKKWIGYIATGMGIIISLTLTSAFVFSLNLPSSSFAVGRQDEILAFSQKYYITSHTRMPPFFVGMLFGYFLYTNRFSYVKTKRVIIGFYWLVTLGCMSCSILAFYPILQEEHSSQLFDNIVNAYSRTTWSIGVGLLIVACHSGHGGPINWFLSLKFWKIPAHLSFAMYLAHYPLQLVIYSGWTKTHHFSTNEAIYRYFSDLVVATLAACLLTLSVEIPFNNLQQFYFKKENPTKSKTNLNYA